MFKIETLTTDEEARTLTLSEQLFHEALADSPESKARYHVKMTRARILTSYTGIMTRI